MIGEARLESVQEVPDDAVCTQMGCQMATNNAVKRLART